MAKPDIKSLVVNHFEKGIFVVVCLLAVVTLAGTRWFPYKGHPNDIKRAVKEADEKIMTRQWPEEEKENFVVPPEKSVETLVNNNIHRQVDSSPYMFDKPFVRDLYEVTKPIVEPEYDTVQYVLADAGRFLMPVQPKEDAVLTDEDPAEMADAAEEEDDQSDIPEQFRTNKAKGPAMGAPGSSGGLGLGLSGDTAGEYAAAMSAGAAYGGGEAGLVDFGMEEAMAMEGSMGMGGMGMASQVEGRGMRFVAVRGIIPLREQVRKFMKAIHVSYSRAAEMYEIIDFELERKKMQPGDDPWGADWEPVDVEIALDVLNNEALTLNPEVVPGSITDVAVTMPLPGRLYGIWKSKATHPKLENFTLTQDEIDKELEFNRRLLEQYEQQQKDAPTERVKKKGFSSVAHDARSMMSDALNMDYQGSMGLGMGGAAMSEMAEEYGGAGEFDYGSGGAMDMGYSPVTSINKPSPEAQKFIEKLQKEFGNSKEEQDKALLEYITKRVTAQGELLLFRYFDFDVEPGATYQYRTRLIVRNPNYDLPIAQVGGVQQVVTGQTRTTDWSNVTEPVTVPPDVDYFVARIDENSSGLAEARMAVFQWNPDYGTTIHDSLDILVGEEIGGPKETFVLDPAKSSFEIEPYEFHTGDVLVDALPEDTVKTNEHPDLELPRRSRGSLGISGQVIISQSNGQLAVIDHFSRLDDLKERRTYLEYEQKPFEDIKNSKGKEAEMTDMEAYGMGGEYDMGMGMGMGMEPGGGAGFGTGEDFGRGQLRGNALRKRGRGRGTSSGSGASSSR